MHILWFFVIFIVILVVYRIITYPTIEEIILSSLERFGEMSGRDLRKKINDKGCILSSPGFYQIMAMLEESDWVESRNENKCVNGHTVRQHLYKLTEGSIRKRDRSFNQVLARGIKGLFPVPI